MIAYVDSSVVLRWVFKAPDTFSPGPGIEGFSSSALLRVECLRAIDRARHLGELTAEEAAECLGVLQSRIRDWTLLPITDKILDAASATLPVSVATLDAIHLASAIHLKRNLPDPLVFVTHDRTQTTAARAMGLEIA